jgi:hypothetical protein
MRSVGCEHHFVKSLNIAKFSKSELPSAALTLKCNLAARVDVGTQVNEDGPAPAPKVDRRTGRSLTGKESGFVVAVVLAVIGGIVGVVIWSVKATCIEKQKDEGPAEEGMRQRPRDRAGVEHRVPGNWQG